MAEGPVEITIAIGAPPERVAAYFSPEAWRTWQGVEVAYQGDDLAVTMHDGSVMQGSVRSRSIAGVSLEWGWLNSEDVPPGSTSVRIDLIPQGLGTRLMLRHHRLPFGAREPQRMLWRHHLTRLRCRAEGQDPGPDEGPRLRDQ